MKKSKLSSQLRFLTIYNTKQRLQLLLVAALFLITSAVETAALAVIYPFMSSLLNPAEIASSSWHRLFAGFIDLPSDRAYFFRNPVSF